MDGSCELERRLIGEQPGLEVKTDLNGRTVIRGYAAVFESESQDLGGFHEIVERGAFDEVMRSNPDVFGKYNHTQVIGRTSSGTMRLFVDERGLRYEIDPPKSAEAVVELISRGDVRGSSFAFRSNPKDESWQRDAGGRMIRRIKKFSYLGDAGPVDTPAYLATETYVSKRALEMANDERAVSPVVEDTAQPVPAGGAEGVAEVPLEGETEKRAASVMHAQGDFVSWDGGVGRIEHIMEEGQLGEYSEEPLPATPDDPAVLIRLWESEDGEWEETDYFIGRRMSELTAHADVSESSPDDERAVSLKPTSGMAAAAKRGLKLHEEGKSGDGLKPETVARANRLARREEMNPEWLREMNAWFARHESASKSPGWDKAGEEKPGFVAWLLWGGTPAKNWAARKVKQMQASDRSIDYVGKAAALKSVMLSTHLHTK
jgi:hypothetical protein